MVPGKLQIRTSLLALVLTLLLVPVLPVFGVGREPTGQEFSRLGEIEFALTAESTGWIRSGSRLFRTESNGADWQDVTPALSPDENLVDASFLDSTQALALTMIPNVAGWQLTLLKTTDSGSTWQVQPVSMPSTEHNITDVPFGGASLQWHGAESGWILIKQATSINFSVGFLLHTVDAGQTWAITDPPAAEEFVFVDEKMGFLRDPVNPTKLYQTLDSGNTWKSIQPLVTNLAVGELQRVGLPIAWQGGELLLPVWVKNGEIGSELAFYSSPSEMLSNNPDLLWAHGASPVNPQSWAESFGSDLIVTQLSSLDGKSLWLGLSGSACKQAILASESDFPLSTIACENETVLLSSSDGGGSWQQLNLPVDDLPATTETIQQGIFQNLPDADQRLNTVQWIQIYQGQGFDACEIPTLSKLQAWFNGSPYQSVNLYIGGISRYCNNTALNATYLQQMFNQGWRFIPTWVGPQAPCTTFKNRFSWDTEEAYDQGVDNANQARAKLLELGLTNPDGTGSVVYDDLEYFTYSATCSAAARAFVQGWSTRLQELGIVSGLYASSSNLNQNKIYNLQPPPYAAWIAEWYRVPGYRPDVTVWDVDWLDDKYWSHHQRVFQYSGSHDETWGGVTINIDNNVLDGLVAAPYGADLIPPVTTYSEAGTIGISPWYKTPVTVTLNATDNSVGVKHTYYRANLGNWNLYTEPVVFNWSGLVTIDYVSVDRVNNWESLKSASFYVDSEPPVNPRVTDPGCPAFNGVPQAYCNDPWFTWAGAYDLGVGLSPTDTYEYYWGTNPQATAGTRTTATQYNPPATSSGVPYYLRIRTQDRQGLWSSWQTIYTFIYDYRFTHQNWLPRVTK